MMMVIKTMTMNIKTTRMIMIIIDTLKFGASLYCLTYIGNHSYYHHHDDNNDEDEHQDDDDHDNDDVYHDH